MKIRTESQLMDHLDWEFSWRLKEIDFLKKAVQRTSNSALRRAGIPLVYAHWEGFVKAAAEGMLCFVSLQRKQYRELALCFAVHGLAGDIDVLTESKKHHRRVTALNFLMNKMDERAGFGWKGRIATRGNLNFERFCGIAAAVGIDASRYDTRRNFVDQSLLRRRNEIAHGARLDLTVEGFRYVADEVLVLLRWFKTDLENSIARNSYLVAP